LIVAVAGDAVAAAHECPAYGSKLRKNGKRGVAAPAARDVAREKIDERPIAIRAEPRGIAPADLRRRAQEIAVVEVVVVHAVAEP
jgi:hypothetical protein